MQKEAEEHKAEDEKRKQEVDTKNEAEQLVFQTEKSLKDLGDKVTDSEKTEVEGLIKDLKDALEKNDLDDIKTKKDKLQEKAMALATRVYEEAAKQQQANTNTTEESSNTNSSSDNDVHEAEYEEK